MTILVHHQFSDEGSFLPSAIIEAQIHRIQVALDKRINVFQLLEGPIINVTKVLLLLLGSIIDVMKVLLLLL